MSVTPKMPDRAFILAAGLGTRLRPYTDTLPKPLVPAAGRPIIDHVIDRLVEGGIKKIVVNLHYKADLLRAHLETRQDAEILFSHEEKLMNTGGGIKKALPLLGDDPFFVVSGDSFWTDDPGASALRRMAAAWDGQKMDLLLMVQPLSRMTLTQGRGDYDMDPASHALTRAQDKGGAFMWTSVRMCAPALFENTPEEPFSFLELMDRSQARARLCGLEHKGEWHHISTPEDLERVNCALRGGTARQSA